MDTWASKKDSYPVLRNQLFPILGDKLFPALEPADFLTAIQKAESRGAVKRLTALHSLCGQVSRYARIIGAYAFMTLPQR